MADEVRKDPKGRKLRTGETYDEKTGRYRYSYFDAKGKRCQLYSWTLTKNDPIPSGKKQKRGESLREKIDKALADKANEVDTQGGNMSVYSLLERYVAVKSPDVKQTTRNGYRTQLHFMQTDPMGRRKIRTVTEDEAILWFDSLHHDQEKSYSTLHTLRGMLRPAFVMAKKNRWVVSNPFDFPMLKKRYGGTKTRDALSRKDMRRFLDFVRTDKHFSKYFNGIYILFNTGLRISEFCGLTPEDIDFDNHVIHVRWQLLRNHNGDTNQYYIEEGKTVNAIRDIPMLPDVESAFREVMASRPNLPDEMVVWDETHTVSKTGFLWLDKDNHVEVAQHWENHLRWARTKYNRIYKEEMPPVSPHICRHTFCSNCASAGMSPKTLQMIMGHSSIEFTLNVYTHVESGDVKAQFFEVNGDSGQYKYGFYPLDRKPDVVSLADDSPDDEGEPDLDAPADDDDDE